MSEDPELVLMAATECRLDKPCHICTEKARKMRAALDAYRAEQS